MRIYMFVDFHSVEAVSLIKTEEAAAPFILHNIKALNDLKFGSWKRARRAGGDGSRSLRCQSCFPA